MISNAKCQKYQKVALAIGISNLLPDCLFLALPIPMIWNLQMPKRINASLTGVFMPGILQVSEPVLVTAADYLENSVCATCIIRVHVISYEQARQSQM